MPTPTSQRCALVLSPCFGREFISSHRAGLCSYNPLRSLPSTGGLNLYEFRCQNSVRAKFAEIPFHSLRGASVRDLPRSPGRGLPVAGGAVGNKRHPRNVSRPSSHRDPLSVLS